MGSKKSAFLDDIKLDTVQTSTGPCEMPVLYRSAKFLLLLYRVDIDRAGRLLGAGPLEPFVIFGKVLVLLGLFEYRDSGLGAYNEVSLGVLIKRRGTSPSPLGFLRNMRGQEEAGIYIINLPVTTERAYAGGIEIWGLPKYVTGIEVSFRPDKVAGSLQNELELTSTKVLGVSSKSFPLVLYSIKNDRLLKTVAEIGGKCHYCRGQETTVRILGEGPTANNIKALGLDAVKPSLAIRSDNPQGILPIGKDLGAATM